MNLGMISGGAGRGSISQSVVRPSFFFFPFILHIYSYFLLGEKRDTYFLETKIPPKELASLSW